MAENMVIIAFNCTFITNQQIAFIAITFLEARGKSLFAFFACLHWCSPLCDTPIRRTIRYKSITNSMLRKLEEVKCQIAEENFWASKKLRRDNVEREKG